MIVHADFCQTNQILLPTPLSIEVHPVSILLNQAHAGLQPAHTWFLSIPFVRKCQYVYVSAPEAINNYWHDVV